MSEQEQEKIIQQLREQVVKINTEKPSTPQKVEEKDVLEKAREAGDTVDDDTLPPTDTK